MLNKLEADAHISVQWINVMLSKKILEIWAGGGNDIKLKLTFILPEE
jgi:hypothetical protein